MPSITWIHLLAGLYVACGIIDTFAYLPTIQELRKGKPSASSRSYALWSATSIIGVLYAWLVVEDIILVFVMSIDLVACLTILTLRLRLKDK